MDGSGVVVGVEVAADAAAVAVDVPCNNPGCRYPDTQYQGLTFNVLLEANSGNHA